MVLLPDLTDLVLLIVGLGGILVLGFGLRELWLAYRMRATESIPIGSIADQVGSVEIEGVARPAESVLTAPFTETDCLVYAYEIKELQRDEDDDVDWRTIDSGSDRVPFWLEDDTGRVLIKPAGAALRLDTERAVRARRFEESLKAGRAPPAGVGIDLPDLLTDQIGERKYIERRIDPGEPVYVFGTPRSTLDESLQGDQVITVIEDQSSTNLGRGRQLVEWVLATQLFLIADSSERGALRRVVATAVIALFAGIVALATAIALSFSLP